MALRFLFSRLNGRKDDSIEPQSGAGTPKCGELDGLGAGNSGRASESSSITEEAGQAQGTQSSVPHPRDSPCALGLCTRLWNTL